MVYPYRIGTSSFSETDWVGNFYPAGTKPADFLTVYASKFTTVEIDATYYAIPARRTVENWVRKTPEGFLICAKFPKSIVHGGDGPTPDPNVVLVPDITNDRRDRFLDVIAELGDRLGPLVVQFPYFAKRVFSTSNVFMDRLDRFLADLPRNFRYAVEIRNRRWLTPQFADMLRRHDVALVLVDHAWMPHGEEVMEMFDPVTTDFAYLRLLGDRKGIEEITTTWDREVIDHRESMIRWVDLVARFAERDIESLIYINNHYAGHAPTTADRLTDMLEKRLRG